MEATFRIVPDSSQGAGLHILTQTGHWLSVNLERCRFPSISSCLPTGAKWLLQPDGSPLKLLQMWAARGKSTQKLEEWTEIVNEIQGGLLEAPKCSLHHMCQKFLPGLLETLKKRRESGRRGRHWPKEILKQQFHFILFVFSFPRLGVTLELQLPAYATATAMEDLSRVCDHSSQQRRILNLLSEAGDRTCLLMDPSRVRYH